MVFQTKQLAFVMSIEGWNAQENYINVTTSCHGNNWANTQAEVNDKQNRRRLANQLLK
jgi:hypothetical protein